MAGKEGKKHSDPRFFFYLFIYLLKQHAPLQSNITCILLHFSLSVPCYILDLIYALIHYLYALDI